MIDNYLLAYLVAFAQTGTIEKAAEQLGVTQPTISRGLKKLEMLLAVKLFDRQPQKLSLTATGKYTARRAALLLKQQRDFKQAVQQYDNQNSQLKIAATLPGPLLLFKNYDQFKQVVINPHTISPKSIATLLTVHHYALILSTHELHTKDINSQLVGHEQLAIKITKYNSLYQRSTVHFADLNGHEFILAKDLGEWQKVIEANVPHGQFFYQSRRSALQQLINQSNFPIFKTNITDYLDQQLSTVDSKRKLIPITDESASLPIYISYLDSNWPQIQVLVTTIKNILHNVPLF